MPAGLTMLNLRLAHKIRELQQYSYIMNNVLHRNILMNTNRNKLMKKLTLKKDEFPEIPFLLLHFFQKESVLCTLYIGKNPQITFFKRSP
jgi:hypothetical protein